MGRGGYLWIVNATSKTLKAGDVKSYQMDAWKFSDIPKQSKKRFYIEFCEGIFKTPSDDAGEASFLLEGTDNSFELQVRWPYKEGECGLKVEWRVDTSAYEVFPPKFQSEACGKLGWIHDGSLSLLIMENGTVNSVSTDIPGEDSIVSASVVQYTPIQLPESSLYKSWMKYYSASLQKLTLGEMTLPGTHDSGTYDPVSAFGSPWIKTQSMSLAQQLNHGIRVLDLRNRAKFTWKLCTLSR